MIKIIFIYCCNIIGSILSYIYPRTISHSLEVVRNRIYTAYLRRRFKHLGNSVIKWKPLMLMGAQYIQIGNGTVLGKHIQLTARCVNANTPSIIIGDDCLIREGSHITAINSIRIGNHLLTGTNVLITDNSHGSSTPEDMCVPPVKRSLHSKGPVVIGNNVWMGSNVCVMPGVTIGDGAIIGANSIITHDIPAFCVAAGIPANVIKEPDKDI